jgi:hypothetical protein
MRLGASVLNFVLGRRLANQEHAERKITAFEEVPAIGLGTNRERHHDARNIAAMQLSPPHCLALQPVEGLARIGEQRQFLIVQAL